MDSPTDVYPLQVPGEHNRLSRFQLDELDVKLDVKLLVCLTSTVLTDTGANEYEQ